MTALLATKDGDVASIVLDGENLDAVKDATGDTLPVDYEIAGEHIAGKTLEFNGATWSGQVSHEGLVPGDEVKVTLTPDPARTGVDQEPVVATTTVEF